MWKNRHLGDAAVALTARFLSSPLLFSAHFLTARRIARYEDQMRTDRVSSIVYTLKKPSIINLDHDLLPSVFDSSLPLLLFRLSISSFCFLNLFGSFVRKELPAVKRLLSRRERRSSARIDRIPLFSIRRFESRPTTGKAKREYHINYLKFNDCNGNDLNLFRDA